MADIEQLRAGIQQAVADSQQRRIEFEQGLEDLRLRLEALQQCVAQWIESLALEGVEIHYAETTQTLTRFEETYQLTLHEQTVSMGACKLHLKPEEQYLSGHRVLLYASTDEDDIKEVVEAEGAYRYSDLQYGQRRDLSQYDTLSEEAFYRLLYGWLKA
ncbi:hypothetical protein GY26_14190 [Gammaproteobacteria bacterium MFB021]|nr:hypothetical protein GY26_14190 [Gammaproteobacteria bacterium MFB021]